MSRSRFAGLNAKLDPKPAPQESLAPVNLASMTGARAKARQGKKAVVGYFSQDMSRMLRQLALDEGTSVQALLGEAIDLLMRARGKHPFGER
jgi:hypothetical protein